jgi:UDP:flavonoid glycosyltransferase YjiC (YdhE family)
MPALQQVDILKAGVDLFLTHGGQNSFTEALSEGVPLVVCPGFGDQPVNARKAVDLGVGLQVERPVPADGQESQAAWTYRSSVCAALQEVFSERSFAVSASGCSERLRAAGGVSRAVQRILDLAAGATVIDACATLPTLLTTGAFQTDAEKKRGHGGKIHGGVGVSFT